MPSLKSQIKKSLLEAICGEPIEEDDFGPFGKHDFLLSQTRKGLIKINKLDGKPFCKFQISLEEV